MRVSGDIADPMGLDIVNLFITFEKEFDLEIPNSEAAYLTTPGKVIDWVFLQLETLGRPVPREHIAQAVKRITLEHSSIPERIYREEARFVNDFCMD
jgi:hypothetical protein